MSDTKETHDGVGEEQEMDEAFIDPDAHAVELGDDNDMPPEDEDGSEGDGEEMEMGGEDDMGADIDPNLPDMATHTFDKHTDSVCAACLSPVDPNQLASGACDDQSYMYVFTPSDKVTQYHDLKGHADTVSAVQFGFDGTYVATAGYDAEIHVWKAATGEPVAALEGPSSEVEWIAWHPKGHALIAGSEDATAWMWWGTTGKVMAVFAGHGGPVTCGSFGMGGKVVCTGSADGSAIVWNPKTAEATHTFRPPSNPNAEGPRGATWHTEGVVSLACHQSLPLMATGSEDGSGVVSNIESGKILAKLGGHEDSVEAIGFCRWDSSPVLLATGGLDGLLQIWDCSRFDVRHSMKHTRLSSSRPAPDANGVVSGQQVAEGVWTDPHGPLGGIIRLKWHPAGAPLVATASTDATIRLWDARTGRCEKVLTGHRAPILDFDIAPLTPAQGAGNANIRLLSGSDDHTLKLFDVLVQV